MSNPAQADLAVDQRQATWSPPKSKIGCRRDPQAGPGSCWHWWDGCPRAEARGCHLLWLKEQKKASEAAG